MSFAPTLLPLFARSCDHLGWLEPGRAVFDREMALLAFVIAGHAFHAGTLEWLGPVDRTTLCDPGGYPLAFHPDHAPRNAGGGIVPPRPGRPVTPGRPVRPLPPRRPLIPAAPPLGWSPLTFAEWIARGSGPGAEAISAP